MNTDEHGWPRSKPPHHGSTAPIRFAETDHLGGRSPICVYLCSSVFICGFV